MFQLINFILDSFLLSCTYFVHPLDIKLDFGVAAPSGLILEGVNTLTSYFVA